jgi:phage terminase small subunit
VADLTPKQERFVGEYLIDLNAAQAAIRAGYSPRSAEVEGSRLLRNAKVGDVIARAKADRSARTGLTADRVLDELAAIGFAKIGDHATWDSDDFTLLSSSETDTRPVLEVKMKETVLSRDGKDTVLKREKSIKLHDKVGTLKLLGQHLGMFADKVEHTGKDGAPLVFTIAIDRKDVDDASNG